MIAAVLAVMLLTGVASQAQEGSKAVCDLLADSEAADLLGQPSVQKRSILGANDCTWSVKGYSLSVMRLTDEPETATMMVDVAVKNPRKGDVVREEPGIGQRAASTVSWTGRGLSLVTATGATAWTLVLERIDQKIDVEKALPKMRAIAKRLAGGGA